jgi:uncharacterized protein YbjT (DUF2867 family)
MFVEQLKKSGLDYCVVRPNGFFSDMTDFYKIARKGRVYLFGNGDGLCHVAAFGAVDILRNVA